VHFNVGLDVTGNWSENIGLTTSSCMRYICDCMCSCLVPTLFFIYITKHNRKYENLITKHSFGIIKPLNCIYLQLLPLNLYMLLLSRFNNGPTPNRPMVVNDI
jgi:hypothetical protein